MQAAVNKVFQQYLLLCRKIQLTYLLEPAGSHGVWGLDDYQHLAFLFGASQLCKNPRYVPDSIHTESALREHDDYMYFGCIKFIKDTKKGVSFGECSPMLNDISAVPTWDKVSQGLVKMYLAEVIGKHPVIKHLKFGSILAFKP
jgi:serine/threonine-protein phosphatase 2A activator